MTGSWAGRPPLEIRTADLPTQDRNLMTQHRISNWRTSIFALAVVATCLVVGLVVYARSSGPDGAASPEAVVADYVTALRDKNCGRLADIADPENDSATEINRRISELGGDRLVISDRRFDETASAAEVRVTLSGQSDASPYSDVIWLRRIDDAWFVALGPHQNSNPKGTL
ncbi:hypothetical protein I0C86_07690 [Plantactinospora sp. S1510]|uniref:DUF4878 domain-containing protein n=1 Tax=Plantactinospora alkalitolerans TaxID=2789879 RepID=A0ABS0GRR7_9ACTN|nr:hypothetical protein [Plantactinospora alkalitolerans]MBF9128865.1 hypothetical protein [Plantactinospora alkalitolerans]